MKRCPQCRRDYYDDSLAFCLDDGARLLEGPSQDTTQTAIIPSANVSDEGVTRTFDNQSSEDLPKAFGTRGSANATSPENQVRQQRAIGIAIAAVALLLIAGLAWAGYSYYVRGYSRQIESIAVMPFLNGAGNPELEYLSDGLTESLINSLSQIPKLSVKARTSVFTYKGKEVPPQQLARELSVQAILYGRVQQRSDQVILNLELVDAGTGNQIWGEQYTRKITDLVQLQSEIARDISGKLRARLTGDEQKKIAKTETENTEAYQLYLRGRYHWNKRRPDDLRKSIEYFLQAIDKDPTYALAYASLAEAYVLIPNYRLGPQAEYYPKARTAALKAIEINESLAAAHNALALIISNYDWKFAEAENEWHKTLALDPNYATGHQWYGEFLLLMGRFPEALTEMRRAQELDPLSLIINGMVGVAMVQNGQTESGLEQLKKTIDMEPNFPRTHLFLADTYEDLGRYEEAVDEFSKYFAIIGLAQAEAPQLAEKLKSSFRAGGAKAYSRAFAEMIEKNQSQNGAPVSVLAGYWVRAGEIDKAFAALETAYSKHDDSILSLKHRNFDPIKSDPRYKDLLRRVGLPE